MALVAQEIPKVGLVMETARLVRWLKQVGESVKQGEPLLELETEKAVVEIEATASGRLAQILLQVDEQARVGDRVAWLDDGVANECIASDGAAEDAMARAEAASASAAPARRESPQQKRSSQRVRSSPVARRLSVQHGIDLHAIAGSGPGGRVQLADVQRAIDTRAGDGAPRAADAAGMRELSSMRRAVARAMTLSNATVPQFLVERAVDWSSLQQVRAQLNAAQSAGAVKVSVNDFLLQAVARALLEFPAVNATFVGDPASPEARLAGASGAHIGMVVALQDGLLVPVLHGVEKYGLIELSRLRADCVARALSGRLKREELEGATFSISNLGSNGPDRFTAVINPPQSAILAVGRQRDCAVVRHGDIQVRPISELSLTVDHRVVDGRLAADFLARLVAVLEGGEWRR